MILPMKVELRYFVFALQIYDSIDRDATHETIKSLIRAHIDSMLGNSNELWKALLAFL